MTVEKKRCSDCGGRVQRRRSRCPACLARARDAARAGYQPYVPIDEWMDRATSRAMLALRHFDWVSTSDLADALGIPGQALDRTRYETHHAAMAKLIKSGRIEVMRFGRHHMVRLAPSVDRKTIVPMDWSVIA